MKVKRYRASRHYNLIRCYSRVLIAFFRSVTRDTSRKNANVNPCTYNEMFLSGLKVICFIWFKSHVTKKKKKKKNWSSQLANIGFDGMRKYR